MSFEPGGTPIGHVAIAGTDSSSGLYIYPTLFNASAAGAGGSGGSGGGGTGSGGGLTTILGVLFFIGVLGGGGGAGGNSGVSEIFYVAPDPDMVRVSLDPETFLVAPGRTQ